MGRLFLKFLKFRSNLAVYRSFCQHVQYVPKGNRSEFDAGLLRQKSMDDSCRPDRSLGAYVMFGE